jgi:hypothetical protein
VVDNQRDEKAFNVLIRLIVKSPSRSEDEGDERDPRRYQTQFRKRERRGAKSCNKYLFIHSRPYLEKPNKGQLGKEGSS